MKTLLLVTQVYLPDPASVGQHMADAAEAMAARGWRVVVLTANRGYDNPRERFASREVRNGVEIRRLPLSSLGKKTILHRLAGQLSFCLQAFFHGLFLRPLSTILVTTSPPMGSVVGWAVSLFRRVSVKFWVMDINPDQSVRLGAFSPGHPFVRIFNGFNRRILRGSDDVIVLDRYMAEVVAGKVGERGKVGKWESGKVGSPFFALRATQGTRRSAVGGQRSAVGGRRSEVGGRGTEGGGRESQVGNEGSNEGVADFRTLIPDPLVSAPPTSDSPTSGPPRFHVLPPWPMEGYLERVEHGANPFRREHGLEGKFVVMYSGNHSLAHPLDTVLEAALRMRDEERVIFLFVGGGRGKDAVERAIAEKQPPNIRSLPYQPIEAIKFSLSAADLHLVSMGPEMVGVVHPCKFYGAMALAKPILFLGPRESHIGDVMAGFDCGWQVDHGDVDGAERLLRSLPDLDEASLLARGRAGREAVERDLGKDHLCKAFCNVLSADTHTGQQR